METPSELREKEDIFLSYIFLDGPPTERVRETFLTFFPYILVKWGNGPMQMRHAEMIVLRFGLNGEIGKTYKEIAEIFGISAGNVGGHIQHALRRLRCDPSCEGLFRDIVRDIKARESRYQTLDLEGYQLTSDMLNTSSNIKRLRSLIGCGVITHDDLQIACAKLIAEVRKHNAAKNRLPGVEMELSKILDVEGV